MIRKQFVKAEGTLYHHLYLLLPEPVRAGSKTTVFQKVTTELSFLPTGAQELQNDKQDEKDTVQRRNAKHRHPRGSQYFPQIDRVANIAVGPAGDEGSSLHGDAESVAKSPHPPHGKAGGGGHPPEDAEEQKAVGDHPGCRRREKESKREQAGHQGEDDLTHPAGAVQRCRAKQKGRDEHDKEEGLHQPEGFEGEELILPNPQDQENGQDYNHAEPDELMESLLGNEPCQPAERVELQTTATAHQNDSSASAVTPSRKARRIVIRSSAISRETGSLSKPGSVSRL